MVSLMNGTPAVLFPPTVCTHPAAAIANPKRAAKIFIFMDVMQSHSPGASSTDCPNFLSPPVHPIRLSHPEMIHSKKSPLSRRRWLGLVSTASVGTRVLATTSRGDPAHDD